MDDDEQSGTTVRWDNLARVYHEKFRETMAECGVEIEETFDALDATEQAAIAEGVREACCVYVAAMTV